MLNRNYINTIITIALALFFLPELAYANRLGGLAYLVYIWPVGALLVIVSVILTTIGIHFLKTSTIAHSHSTFAWVLIAIGSMITFFFPIFTIWCDHAFDAGGPIDAKLVTIIPVIIVGIILVIIGLKLR
jgi:hypothetical protein